VFFSKNKRERIQDIEQAIADYYAVDRVYTKTDAIVVLADPAKYAVGKKQTIEISLGFTVKYT